MIDSLQSMNDSINDNIRSLNSGGCGVYAWMVARALDQLPIIAHASCTVITNDRKAVNLNLVRKHLERDGGLYNPRNWWGHKVYFDHVIVQYRPKGSDVLMAMDSKAICPLEEWANEGNTALGHNVHPGKIEWQVMRELTRHNHHHGWNTSYDRSQGPKLARIIKQYLG